MPHYAESNCFLYYLRRKPCLSGLFICKSNTYNNKSKLLYKLFDNSFYLCQDNGLVMCRCEARAMDI